MEGVVEQANLQGGSGEISEGTGAKRRVRSALLS